jgi:hypothetical protein
VVDGVPEFDGYLSTTYPATAQPISERT